MMEVYFLTLQWWKTNSLQGTFHNNCECSKLLCPANDDNIYIFIELMQVMWCDEGNVFKIMKMLESIVGVAIISIIYKKVDAHLS